MSDAQLIAAFRKGESKCFDEIIERHEKRLRHFLYHVLHNTTLVDDALQETFTAAWNKIRSGQYHEEGNFGTWLSTIAFHAAMRMLRNENHFIHPEHLPELPEEQFEDGQADEKQLLDDILQKLPEHERQAIMMHDKNGLDYEAIGKELRIRPSSARRNHERAVTHLKQMARQEKNK